MNDLKSSCWVLFFFIVPLVNIQAANRLTIFVSILPQQYFVQQVGADHVEVHVMVGPGQNPATYEPTPQQMLALANADLYFSIGVPFESVWLDKIKSNNKRLSIIECCDFIADLAAHDHLAEHHSAFDPHVWTDPNKVKQITNLLEKSLLEIDQKNSLAYKNAAMEFTRKLNELDAYIKEKMIGLKKRELIVSHPSWGYFADRYAFEQISIEQEGKEIQAYSMVKLIQLAKQKNIKAVFVQPQFNNRAAKVIAKEIGATVFYLDPLAFDYIANMQTVVEKIVSGLSHD